MNEYLSTRQVIDILKVDRITIYRMLQDGRLKGIKIGQQWRFSKSEVERLLSGSASQPTKEEANPSTGFPTHCVQTIQDLFSRISGLSALMIDVDGNPLTEITHPCSFCKLLLSHPAAKKDCQETWSRLPQQAPESTTFYTCHAGLAYLVTPVYDGERRAGYFLSSQSVQSPGSHTTDQPHVRELSEKYGIAEEVLVEDARHIPILPTDQQAQVVSWSESLTQAVQSILQERTGYLSRLQQIANLSQV